MSDLAWRALSKKALALNLAAMEDLRNRDSSSFECKNEATWVACFDHDDFSYFVDCEDRTKLHSVDAKRFAQWLADLDTVVEGWKGYYKAVKAWVDAIHRPHADFDCRNIGIHLDPVDFVEFVDLIVPRIIFDTHGSRSLQLVLALPGKDAQRILWTRLLPHFMTSGDHVSYDLFMKEGRKLVASVDRS